MAIASLVCSLLPFCGLTSILAVIFGVIARRQIRESGQQGEGLAIAGLIIGIIGVVLAAIYVIVVVIAVANDPGPSYEY